GAGEQALRARSFAARVEREAQALGGLRIELADVDVLDDAGRFRTAAGRRERVRELDAEHRIVAVRRDRLAQLARGAIGPAALDLCPRADRARFGEAGTAGAGEAARGVARLLDGGLDVALSERDARREERDLRLVGIE